jgi:hypothetical protein
MGNPVNYFDPSGLLSEYAKLNTRIGELARFTIRDFAYSVMEGGVAGLFGYLAGTFSYALYEEIISLRPGEVALPSHILERFIARVNPYDAALSIVFGGFIGGTNYVISQGMADSFWRYHGGALKPNIIDQFQQNMTAMFMVSAFQLTGFQIVISDLMKSSGMSQLQATNMLVTYANMFLVGLGNGFSTIVTLNNYPRSLSIMILIGINTFLVNAGHYVGSFAT